MPGIRIREYWPAVKVSRIDFGSRTWSSTTESATQVSRATFAVKSSGGLASSIVDG